MVFYFQFIDAPSPDLPILIFCSIIFFEFVFSNLNTAKIKTIILFLVFVCFIKLTVIPLLLIPIYLLKKEPSNSIFFIGLGFVFGSLWILKNIIITGYPFFPLNFFNLNLDWKMVPNLFEMVTQLTKDAGYSENLIKTKNLSIIEKLKIWINLTGLNAVFNKGMIILFVIIPFSSFFKLYKFKLLYLILLFHFLFILMNSPQYRFFLPTFILFLGIIIYDVFKRIRLFKNITFIIITTLLSLTLSIFIDLKSFDLNNTNIQQLLIPESNSKYKKNTFEKISILNFEFYNAEFPSIFETSNGALPCVNKKLLKYYNVLPQQRTSEIKDGFYAIEIENE